MSPNPPTPQRFSHLTSCSFSLSPPKTKTPLPSPFNPPAPVPPPDLNNYITIHFISPSLRGPPLLFERSSSPPWFWTHIKPLFPFVIENMLHSIMLTMFPPSSISSQGSSHPHPPAPHFFSLKSPAHQKDQEKALKKKPHKNTQKKMKTKIHKGKIVSQKCPNKAKWGEKSKTCHCSLFSVGQLLLNMGLLWSVDIIPVRSVGEN